MPVLSALALSAVVAILGWQLAALTRAGAVAAAAVGTMVLAATGWAGFLALGTFFAGSSLVSRLAPDRAALFDAKSGGRDALQVLANGAPAALGALLPGPALWIVTASLAAAAADTWATSFGGWSRRPPRSILTGRVVDHGASGGITPLGTAGAVLGASLVGAGPAIIQGAPALFSLALLVGMLGMLLDSFLGASLQGRFHCDRCDRPTERRQHRCGETTRRTGGVAWVSNDGVNALATGTAALIAGGAWWLARG